MTCSFASGDLFGGLVDPVVPLQELVGGLGHLSVPREPTGLAGPDEGTREHECECAAGESPTERFRLVPSGGGEGDVGAPGVPTGEAPFRLAVADQPDLMPISSARAASYFSSPA
jgi:hypothetical protein